MESHKDKYIYYTNTEYVSDEENDVDTDFTKKPSIVTKQYINNKQTEYEKLKITNVDLFLSTIRKRESKSMRELKSLLISR